jgi:hypothetical protein
MTQSTQSGYIYINAKRDTRAPIAMSTGTSRTSYESAPALLTYTVEYDRTVTYDVLIMVFEGEAVQDAPVARIVGGITFV